MGTEIAHYLAQTFQACLVLLEEGSFPAPDAWDDWLTTHGETNDTSVKINQARQLMKVGAELLVLGVDYTDAPQIQDAVTHGVDRFGPIQGFIHNARVLGERSFRLIADTGIQESDWQFEPKVHGLVHITQVLADQPLDFCLLNSSLSSVMGGVGMVAYAAANNFVDAFARQQNQLRGGIWTSVNWDAWKNTQVAAVSADWSRNALAPEEAVACFEQILALGGVEQIVVSTIDLNQRLARGREAAHKEIPHGNDPARTTFHPRPDQLSTLYVPPDDDQEKMIVTVWQEALGVAPIGVLDNFFELGGDSLLAIQTVSQLKKVLQTEIPVTSLYEGLSVRSLALALKQAEALTEQHEEKSAARQEERATRLAQRRKVQEETRARRERRHLS
ncbi:MAG: SDR family NAD(P)-dependent oxidoreductase [Acidobacteria bacterium]|nr:SDR family NAD(P)-dependent oxidoreductase [Acidobacteriota bacterium]